jgi:hypothetical protein
MNKEQRKFKQVIKKRLKQKGRVQFEHDKKQAIINKLNQIKNENTEVKK